MTEVVGPKENRPKALRPSFTYLDHGDRCGCGPDGPMDGPTEEELADHCIDECEYDTPYSCAIYGCQYGEQPHHHDGMLTYYHGKPLPPCGCTG